MSLFLACLRTSFIPCAELVSVYISVQAGVPVLLIEFAA